ncbi:MAG: hypothetical protein ACWA5W_08995 [Phycisphaerales bacterium]
MDSKSVQSGNDSQSGAGGERSRGSARDPLGRLRSLRVYTDRARRIGDDVLMQMGSIKKISDSDARAIEAWNTVVTDQINDCSTVIGLRRGKLVVQVPSASARFVVDRWLKSGGQRELFALARVPMRGVEVRIEQDED